MHPGQSLSAALYFSWEIILKQWEAKQIQTAKHVLKFCLHGFPNQPRGNRKVIRIWNVLYVYLSRFLLQVQSFFSSGASVRHIIFITLISNLFWICVCDLDYRLGFLLWMDTSLSFLFWIFYFMDIAKILIVYIIFHLRMTTHNIAKMLGLFLSTRCWIKSRNKVTLKISNATLHANLCHAPDHQRQHGWQRLASRLESRKMNLLKTSTAYTVLLILLLKTK